jgi:hypothetical protein
VRSLEREAGELAYLSAECAAWKPAVSTALARIAEELAAPPTWRRRTRSELEIRDESDDAGGHGDGDDGGGDEVAVLEAARKAAAEARNVFWRSATIPRPRCGATRSGACRPPRASSRATGARGST